MDHAITVRDVLILVGCFGGAAVLLGIIVWILGVIASEFNH